MTDRLISADALKHYILTKGFYCDTEADRQHSAELVDEVFPTIEPKHGRWIWKDHSLVCSECGKENDRTNFCPNCGARKDEVEECD